MDANGAGRVCPACFYVLRSHALNQQTPEAWALFETYLTTPNDEIMEQFFETATPEAMEAARDRARRVVALREGRE